MVSNSQDIARPKNVALAMAKFSPRHALLGLMLLFSLIVGAAAAYKYSYWGHGFDMVDFHMPIQKTLQGDFLGVSRYNFTDTFMGLDVALGFLPALPFYALLPSAYTLVVLQALLLASGAIPVYLIARTRFAAAWAGVAWAAVYLLYPTTQFIAMAAPFQPRVPGMLCMLWAFYFLQQGRYWPYLLLLFAGMTARTDAALVVIAFGLYALLSRKHWRWWLPPIGVAAIYFYASISYITPLFYSDSFQPVRVSVPFDLSRDYNDMWPCGVSPQACYYLHLGGSLPEIARNIVTHPVQIFFFLFQPAKLEYLVLMFATLLFLPLFAPKELLLAAPIFAINLLSNRVYQYVITEQYQILVIPGMIIAGMYGGAWLMERLGKNSGFRIQDSEGGAEKREPRTQNSEPYSVAAQEPGNHGTRQAGDSGTQSGSPHASRLTLYLVLVLLVGLLNIPLRNPVVSAIRNPERPERVALMERMAAQIPLDARVAATSFLAPHLIPRAEIYFIPGGKMHHQIDEAEFAFIDARAATLRQMAAEGNDIVAALQSDPAWQTVDAGDDLYLFRKRGVRQGAMN
ncbi:DUF2079 domain-containing protein [Candidatus Gracilibacteria bacterium]|nr:DUF2079 domain-containing protein [Candidatus Gracilibacteria bacterium]